MSGVDLSKLKSVKSTHTAKSEKSALDFLNKDINLFPKKLKDRKKERFYMELATLLSSGVDIRTGLELICDEQQSKKDKEFFTGITQEVIKGTALSTALNNTKMISPYEYHSLQIGEETGQTVETLRQLATFFKKKIKQRMQLTSAMIYPVIVLTFSLLAVFFLMKFIVPMFADIFKRFDGELPALTQTIVDISNGIGTYYLYLVFLVLAIIIAKKVFRNSEAYRRMSSKLLLKIPISGGMTKRIYLARFAQSMSLLIRAKVPMLRAIGLVKNMVQFYPIQSSLEQIEKDIMKGKSLHESMAQFSIYSKKMVSLIKVGEEVNKLDEFFDRIADQYNEEVDHKSTVLSSLMEPFIIIFLGLLVAVILIAMYLPLFNLSNTIQ